MFKAKLVKVAMSVALFSTLFSIPVMPTVSAADATVQTVM